LPLGAVNWLIGYSCLVGLASSPSYIYIIPYAKDEVKINLLSGGQLLSSQ